MKELAVAPLIIGAALVTANAPRPVSSDATTLTATSAMVPSRTAAPATETTAADLLARMDHAMLGENSLHTVDLVILRIKEDARNYTSATARTVIDLSKNPARLRESARATDISVTKGKAKVTNLADDLIVSGSHRARRVNYGKWRCVSGRGSLTVPTGIPAVADARSATVVGTTTVDHLSVWHVRVPVYPRSLGAYGSDLPRIVIADLYVSQADYTLVRARADASQMFSGAHIRVTVTDNLSRYGQAVSSKLPSVCK